MNILTKLFLILTLIQLSQCCNLRYYKLVDGDIDESSNEKYPWLVVIGQKFGEEIYKLAYGSLIDAGAVLTSAEGIKSYDKGSLIVQTNCKDVDIGITSNRTKIYNCTSRNILKIIYSEDVNNQTVSDNSYAILILEELFDTNNKINIVNMTTSIDTIDKKNCIFTRWMREFSESQIRAGLVTTSYPMSFSNGSLINLKSFDQNQLRSDRDYIIGKSFHELYDKEMILNDGEEEAFINPLNFLGSPFVCQLKENPQEYAQVGIATFRLIVNMTDDMNTTHKVEQEGSFINIIDLQDEIKQKIKR